MKYIIGFILGIVVLGGSVVYAKSSGMELVNTLKINVENEVFKIYDYDNEVVCYVTDGFYSGGISCLK